MPSEDRERDWQLGQVHRKVDAMERMRGVARYTDDLKLPGMLHAKILRSPHAHARIKGIDLAPALAIPGVFAAVTGQDFKIPYGIIPWTQDENALAVDKVCHVGDGVVAVAAVDEDTANAACKAIRVEYEVLRAFFDPEEALTVRDRENTINPYSRKGNLSKHVDLEFGEVDKELAASELVVEGEYFFEGTTPHRIRVIQPPLGGAFGGKSEPFDLEFCAAKLAIKTGRPVKLLYTREEVFYAHRGRHPMKMKYRTGFAADGKIKAVDAKTIIDGGAYSSFGLVTTYYSGQLLCAPYSFGSYRFDSTRAYTNKPACGPKRGHGSVQPRFAMEIQLDKAAVLLGIDPIELRRRNDIGADTRTVEGAAADAALRARPRGRGLDLHLGHELPDLPQRHAAGGRADLPRPQRASAGVQRGERHRSGQQHDARGDRQRGARAAARRHPRALGRHRPVPGRPRGL